MHTAMHMTMHMHTTMHLLTDALNALGAVLLPLAAALLFEELTVGGLVRLLLAPWPGSRKRKGHNDSKGDERCSPSKHS
ncbi:MAG: hypothetical protein WBD67_04055 [Terracidiphilus sp.]